jgi:ABC-2 type transport system permease protein
MSMGNRMATGMFGRAAAGAIARRDLRRYFSNPTGYVFITLFIFLSAAAAFWQPRFFLNNLANLDQINAVFPLLLLFFIPALTMGVWSDERRQGTDELLLTLPATDVQVVVGKYLAVVGIYMVSLVLSITHVLVLVWLGSPDPGLMVANYLGYWLAGVALIPIGMLASLLTGHAAVAFILGAAFVALPILVDSAAALFSKAVGRMAAPLGVYHHFNAFASGVMSVSGLVYFSSLAAFFLFLNVVVVSRRHWPLTSGTRLPVGLLRSVRAAAIAVCLVSTTVLLARWDIRLDLTAERLHTLSPETRHLIDGLPEDRPVFIQAYVSRTTPEAFVQTRENLLGALREIDALAGTKVELVVHDTEQYSEEERAARERFGITAALVPDASAMTSDFTPVFLGVAFTSGAEEQVIPFFDRGLSPEYEIARAIRVVTRTTRKRIGVVDTDAKLFGGVDFLTGRPRRPWVIVDELRKQYDVVEITPYGPIDQPVDALLVVLPSTLLKDEMEHVSAAIRRGVPSLIVVDPLPAMDLKLSPAAPAAAAVDPYQKTPTIRKNVGDIQAMMSSIGVRWNPARIVWDSYRPHPEMAQMPSEIVFVGPGSGGKEPFSAASPITAGLQELVMLYPGHLQPADSAAYEFRPLVRTGRLAGTVSYFQLVSPSEQGPFLNVALQHQPDPEEQEFVLAAEVRSNAGAGRVNAIVIGDLDFIADQFFEMRAAGPSANFDNITFFLNAIDVLAKDEAFVQLRKRRGRHRTLERLEAQTRAFIEQRTAEERQAEKEAETALQAAQNRLKKLVDDTANRPDLNAQEKAIVARNIEETERRRLEVVQANIERERNEKVQVSRENMEAQTRRIQGAIRTTAVLLPPIPVCCLGLLIFVRRYRREREGAAAVRRLRVAE